MDEDFVQGWRQCYGPGCRGAARPWSKYCSDECGLKLARNRIATILPSRLARYGTSRAQAKEEEEMESLLEEEARIVARMEEVGAAEGRLRETVEAAKATRADPEAGGEQPSNPSTIHCVSCGSEITLRSAMRHMERCYNKHELMFTGSVSDINIGGVYCNKYQDKDSTFCKRLRVLCNEHYPDNPKKDEVCGFPLVVDVFTETGEFCPLPRRSCRQHGPWDRLRQAQLDAQKIKLILRYNECQKRRAQLGARPAHRRAVLGLLLHMTTYHGT